jgi:diguanylate cyclase (GGDEF)-like protein
MVNPASHKAEMEILRRDGAVREYELEIKRADGQTRTVLDTCFSSVDQETGKTLYHGILVDITERKHLENRLLDQSVRDPLTGCYNRRYLEEFETRARELRRTWGCIIIDIDNFKHYNDHYGHKAGDTVLIKMSRFLMRHTRAEEGVIRMGGDEFLVLLSGVDSTGAQNVAKRIITVGQTQAPVPFSLGWAASQPGEKLEKTIDRADQNLLSVRVLERPRNN